MKLILKLWWTTMSFKVSQLHGPFDPLLLREWWRISSPVYQCFKRFLLVSFFSFSDTDFFFMMCYSRIPISCLVNLILSIMQYGWRGGDEKAPLGYWCVLLSGVSICLLNFNFPLWALCPLWHEISMSQGPDWLWLSDLIWASGKQMKSFMVCLSVCEPVCDSLWLCVSILVHKNTKGDKCNHYQFRYFHIGTYKAGKIAFHCCIWKKN